MVVKLREDGDNKDFTVSLSYNHLKVASRGQVIDNRNDGVLCQRRIQLFLLN